jgi:hypothetical protein
MRRKRDIGTPFPKDSDTVKSPITAEYGLNEPLLQRVRRAVNQLAGFARQWMVKKGLRGLGQECPEWRK